MVFTSLIRAFLSTLYPLSPARYFQHFPRMGPGLLCQFRTAEHAGYLIKSFFLRKSID
jgi:hypothetical protein